MMAPTGIGVVSSKAAPNLTLETLVVACGMAKDVQPEGSPCPSLADRPNRLRLLSSYFNI